MVPAQPDNREWRDERDDCRCNGLGDVRNWMDEDSNREWTPMDGNGGMDERAENGQPRMARIEEKGPGWIGWMG
jgi:hypothetical protein